MSDDNTDDLLPSGFSATPTGVGEHDIGVPIFHEALWLASVDLTDLETGVYMGLAYRLMWGTIGHDGTPQLDGELWADPVQMDGLMQEFLTVRDKHRPPNGG